MLWVLIREESDGTNTQMNFLKVEKDCGSLGPKIHLRASLQTDLLNSPDIKGDKFKRVAVLV